MRNKHNEDPKKIGLWKLGRTIGTGSSGNHLACSPREHIIDVRCFIGRVRIARHSRTGQYAAIKIVSKTALNSQVSLDHLAEEMEHRQLAIEREIVVMKLIDHPNVMRLYDVWETSAELFLVLEYVQGGELFEYLCEKGRLPTTEALGYFQQIISAVDYCHRFNIAHRDLKPENILLDKDHNIKIADFGMAAWQVNKQDGMLYTSCGSPHYAAPEIINGEPYNGSAADIWSCGIILFALLSGKLPFDDEDCMALLGKVMVGKFVMPHGIDPLGQDLIRKMLVMDVQKRITMSEIKQHPFYLLQRYEPCGHVMPNLDDIARPIHSASSIDPDIFANLRTLWHGTPDQEIVKNLLSAERNWQKGIYHLLVDYRNKSHQERLADGDLIAQTRTRTKASEQKSTTRRQPASSQLQSEITTPSVSPQVTAEDNNTDVTRIGVATYNDGRSRRRPISHRVSESDDGRRTAREKCTTRPLSVRNKNHIRPAGKAESNKENALGEHSSDVEKTRSRRTKRVHIIDPGDMDLNRLKVLSWNSENESARMPSPSEGDSSSPVSPKHSWLTNIFKFRATNHWLLSTQDVYSTRNECRRLMMEMGAQVILQDPEGLGILKCRLEEKSYGVTRTTKLRVEMHYPGGDAGMGYQVSLLITREKGSPEVFRDIVERLRDQWTFGRQGCEGTARYVIPAGSFGGEIGELVY